MARKPNLLASEPVRNLPFKKSGLYGKKTDIPLFELVVTVEKKVRKNGKLQYVPSEARGFGTTDPAELAGWFEQNSGSHAVADKGNRKRSKKNKNKK
jgi:hypothetical protein